MSKHTSGKHISHNHEAAESAKSRGSGDKKASLTGKTQYRLILILGIAVILLVIAVLGVYFRNRQLARDEYEELRESVRIEEVLPTVEPLPTEDPAAVQMIVEPVPETEPTPEPVEIPVDLPYLQSLNSDVMGWIYVEGTDIDYPVLYDDTDNPYYLDHTRSGKYSSAGSIFVQDINEWGFNDFNTVVYGHNMRDGSMFAGLHRFEEEDFFDEYDTIVVYTNDRVLTYKIFAAYVRDNEHLIKYYTYETEADRQAYIDDIYNHDGNFDYDVDVAPDDRIISLSTCTGWTYTRLIVQGVLISEEPGICISSE